MTAHSKREMVGWEAHWVNSENPCYAWFCWHCSAFGDVRE